MHGTNHIPATMRTIFSAFAFVAVLLPGLRAQDTLVFDQRYKSGHRYHQTVTTEQEMDLDLGTQKQEQRTSMTMGIAAVVADGPGGTGKRVTITYDHAAMTQSAGGQKFSFDSKQPAAANAGPLAVLGGIVGREFKVLFDNDDKVVDVEDFEATMQRLSGGNPATAKLYTQLFNKETVKRMMEQSALRSPPGKPVKVGEAWPFSNELEMPGIGKLLVTGFYTFKGMMNREGTPLAQVAASASIQIQVGTEPTQEKTATLISQMKMKLEEGLMEGTLLYDPAIKFTRDVRLTQRITLTAEVPDGTRKTLRLPMKQSIQMTLDDFGPVKKEEAKGTEK
jgi:hypothetical protein